MIVVMPRLTWVRSGNNITEARKKIKDTTKIMAIVKADAYGHGAVPVAKSLLDLVDAYGVATLEEAVELRKNKIDKMILILGYTPEGDYEDLILLDISQAVYTKEMAQKLSDMAVKLAKKPKCILKSYRYGTDWFSAHRKDSVSLQR